MKPFIGYHFLHGAGRIGRAQAYAQLHQAMRVFSDQNQPTVFSMMLNMRADNSESLEYRVRRICDSFGPVQHTTTSPTWKAFRAYNWKLTSEQFQTGFLLLDEFDQRDPSLADRTSVHASWKFKFVEPRTGQVLSGQEDLPMIDFRLGPGSSLNFGASKKASAYAWLLFPFEDPMAGDFRDYVARFQKELIFTFSPKHWRLWRFSRGEWRPRRFVPSWYC